MMTIRRSLKLRGATAAALACGALLLSACGSSSKSNSTTSASAAASSTPAAPASTPAAPASTPVATTKGPAGTYLTGAGGRAIYLWVADGMNQSACSGSCAKVWPPVTTSGTPRAGGSVKASDLGTITRSDGTKQLTYQGHPLYYYVTDTSAGSTQGQGSDSFGAKWWLVAPSGSAITSGQTVSQGSTTTTTSSSGGGWG